MRSRTSLATTVLAVFACAYLCAPALAQDSTWQKDLVSWRAEHTADVLKPDGWLSLTGLEWLEPRDNSLGSAGDNKIHLPAGPPHLPLLPFETETVNLKP